MYKTLALFLIFVCRCAILPAQNEVPREFSSLDEALAEPAKVKSYSLDCNIEDDSLFFSCISKFPNLNTITITGFQKSILPVEFFNAKQIVSINFIECIGLKYPALFASLKSFNGLTTLTFNESDINQVPNEIAYITDLSSLTFTNCENLNLEKSIPALARVSSLRYLALPVNQLSSLPLNIGMLKQVEVLDISNNDLSDLPDETAGMDNLQNISTQGNIFIRPVQTLEKIRTLNIRYLATSNSISEDEKALIRTLFPNTVIDFKDPDEPVQNNTTPPDSLTTGDVNFGTFQVVSQDYRILSDAYIHFPDVFGKKLFTSAFDSLLFDERYADTTYSNVYKVTNAQAVLGARSYDIFALKFAGNPKKLGMDGNTIMFAFDYSTSFRLNNPEMLAFFGVVWAYKGPLKKHAFRKQFIRNRAARLSWSDVRVDFDNAANIFTIELKSRKGFVSFPAYAVSPATDISRTMPLYGKLYLRYTKNLENRRRRFNKGLAARKAEFSKTAVLSNKDIWESFIKNYFSSDEKKMSRKQWLTYYDYVVGHEQELLNQAEITSARFDRMLELKDYLSCNVAGKAFLFDSAGTSHRVVFTTDSDNALPVETVYVLNTRSKIYYTAGGTIGVSPNELILHKSDDVAIIVLLRNGDIGVLGSDAYRKIIFSSGDILRLKVQVLAKSLTTISQVFQVTGL